jgi:hypothetical protein
MRINKIVLAALFLVLFAGVSRADKFQFMYASENDEYYVSYTNVLIENINPDFNGYTDRRGYILINLPEGIYECKILYRKKWWKVNIKIDGSDELKVVYLPRE